MQQSLRASAFSDSIGQEQLYGALMDQEAAHATKMEKTNKRKRFNSVPIVISFLAPWVIFMATFGVAAYELRYKFPLTALLVELAIIAFSLSNLHSSWKDRSETLQDGFYPLYLSFALALAALCGLACGETTYLTSSLQTIRIQALGSYNNVDPSSSVMLGGEVGPARGSRYQDAGMVTFVPGTYVDVSRSRSYKNKILFCVAPIVNPTCTQGCGLDFWAVGVGCCSEANRTSFHCGEVSNADARSGLREVTDGFRPFFRLAVLQGEASSQAMSPHPIFFEWCEDPELLASNRKRDTFRNFVLLMFVSFLVSGAVLVLSLRWAPALWAYIPGK